MSKKKRKFFMRVFEIDVAEGQGFLSSNIIKLCLWAIRSQRSGGRPQLFCPTALKRATFCTPQSSPRDPYNGGSWAFSVVDLYKKKGTGLVFMTPFS